jgi:hypothetical protein
MKYGEPALGQVTTVEENLLVRVNGRHPWIIGYQFQAGGQVYHGRASTLKQPAPYFLPGREVYVLFMPGAPGQNALYPHP